MARKDATAEKPAPSSGRASGKKEKKAKGTGDDPLRLMKYAIFPVLALSGVALFFSSRSSKSAGDGSGAGASLPDLKGAVELTDSTFDSFLAEHPDGVLVDFYIPGCSHCKKLAPEFNAAAVILKATGGPPLAKLDGEAAPAVAQKLNLTRYPTVLWFKNGESVQELPPQSREGAKIVEFVRYVQEPPYVEFETIAQLEESVPELRNAMTGLQRPVVAGIGGGGSDARVTLRRVAERMRGKVVFLSAAAGEETALVIRAYGHEEAADRVYDGDMSVDALQAWVQQLIS